MHVSARMYDKTHTSSLSFMNVITFTYIELEHVKVKQQIACLGVLKRRGQ